MPSGDVLPYRIGGGLVPSEQEKQFQRANGFATTFRGGNVFGVQIHDTGLVMPDHQLVERDENFVGTLVLNIGPYSFVYTPAEETPEGPVPGGATFTFSFQTVSLEAFMRFFAEDDWKAVMLCLARARQTAFSLDKTALERKVERRMLELLGLS